MNPPTMTTITSSVIPSPTLRRPSAIRPSSPATLSSSAVPQDLTMAPIFSPAWLASPPPELDGAAASDAVGTVALAAMGGGMAAWLAAAANARAPVTASARSTMARRYEWSTETSQVDQGWFGKAWTAVTYQRSVRTTPSSYVSV